MKSGVKKVVKDHRDYSFHRTFGGVARVSFPDNFDLDVGLTNPNQDAEGLPYGCTGYTQTDISTDEDKIQYFPKFTYDETLLMEGIDESNPLFEMTGCDIRTSLKSTIVYGLQARGEAKEQAMNHRRGAYYNVDLLPGQDWFDSLRSALYQNNRSISLAIPWFSTFSTPIDGIVRAPQSYDTTFASWHNCKVCGWKTINGTPYIKAKPWIGSTFGDNGFCYFPPDIVNALLTIDGSGAFTVAPFMGENLQTVRLTIIETIISYIRLILAKL